MCRADGARMWAGPMVPGCRPGRWYGGVPGCGLEACLDFGRAGKRSGGVPGLGACRDVGASCRADGVEVCLADGAEAYRMWGGGMPGLGAGRDEGRRHAGTWGVGASCRADGVEACRADGAEACQD